MCRKSIDDYEKEAINDLQIDITKLKEYMLSLGLHRIKWGRYLYNEETLLAQCEEKINELYKDKYHFYAYKYEEKIEKKSIDVYIKGDSEYKEKEKYYKMQKSKTKMVEQVLNALDKQSFTVNTLLKHMIWESGATVQ